jgi:hypothetical protein
MALLDATELEILQFVTKASDEKLAEAIATKTFTTHRMVRNNKTQESSQKEVEVKIPQRMKQSVVGFKSLVTKEAFSKAVDFLDSLTYESKGRGFASFDESKATKANANGTLTISKGSLSQIGLCDHYSLSIETIKGVKVLVVSPVLDSKD